VGGEEQKARGKWNPHPISPLATFPSLPLQPQLDHCSQSLVVRLGMKKERIERVDES